MGRGGGGLGAWRCKGAPTGEVILSDVDVVHTGGEGRVHSGAGECKIALSGEERKDMEKELKRNPSVLSVVGYRLRGVRCECK